MCLFNVSNKTLIELKSLILNLGHFQIGGKATQALIKAGYSKVSASQIADSNMSKHYIQKYNSKVNGCS
ncbi:terminase small subunit [Orbus hercynius]|uniref:terminase small subunit n=1 Tax=Orbus hercynius TaxID=593135 RepID=UPI000EB312DA